MSGSVKVFAVLTALEGKYGELEALLRGMTVPSRAEPGNLRYDLWQDTENPARFVLDELYQDEEAAAAHKASPHFQHYLSKINELASRMPMAVKKVDVA
ncbi:putative quinol monooxygenase [Rhizobium lentis]|uniref:Antibiotic biosynthesis monooxygenase n=1 Tax=Rhizobium lentis TaxID=1138194 RepID=A0ABS7I939_9HYPH|nr:putative quinol monooxygenase [Rhizobium lentis]MBX5088357.1 antibiotic biosynthesis monooxygenase [Rhizobium lentis]